MDIYLGALEEFELMIEEDFQEEVEDPSRLSEGARALEFE